jgi:hypothetical protein
MAGASLPGVVGEAGASLPGVVGSLLLVVARLSGAGAPISSFAWLRTCPYYLPVSHTATCNQQAHVHEALGGSPVASGGSGLPVRPSWPVSRWPVSRWPAWTRWLDLPELRLAAVAVLAFGLAVTAGVAGAPRLVVWALFGGCYLAGGFQPARDGLRALRRGVLDVDLLMVAAAGVAAGIGQVTDGGLLIVIFATSGALEAVATRRTRDSVRSLLDLAPDRATRLGADGSAEIVETAVLAVGDRVMIRPGERIGADGIVLHGSSDVDQATITGEGLPVWRGPGDEVFAGTSNGSGVLVVEVRRAAGA